MYIRIFFIFLICSLLTDCSKDKNGIISISGITARDEMRTLSGEVDETDWKSDSIIPETAISLLCFYDDIDYSSAEISEIQIIAYPNPFESHYNFLIKTSKETVMKFIMVDESYQVYKRHATKIAPGGTIVAFPTSNYFLNNTYYRIYYAFYDKTKTVYFKGHGDMKKN